MFKRINFLLITLLSLSTFADSGQSRSLRDLSLYELNEHYDVELENDQIWFGGRILSVLDTCMENNTTIRTKEKVRIEEYDGEDFEFIGYNYLYKSIYTTKPYVDGDDVMDVPVTIRTTRVINIVQSDDDFEGDFLFSRVFTTPDCI